MGLIFPNQDVDTVWQRKTRIQVPSVIRLFAAVEHMCTTLEYCAVSQTFTP
jgi:hypothetical protein